MQATVKEATATPSTLHKQKPRLIEPGGVVRNVPQVPSSPQEDHGAQEREQAVQETGHVSRGARGLADAHLLHKRITQKSRDSPLEPVRRRVYHV